MFNRFRDARTIAAIVTVMLASLPATLLPVVLGAVPAQTPADLSRIAAVGGHAPVSEDSFRFVIMGDRTGGHVEGVWAQAVEEVNTLAPDFVMCVGDLIEGYTEDPAELDGMWEEFVALTSRLNAPFFFCPGNHDVSNDMMLREYTARWGENGKSYYSFDYRGCHFVILDSMTAKRLPDFAEEQFTWLEADLAKAEHAQCVLIFYHHRAQQDDPAFWARMLTLADKDKTIIFNGHWHRHVFENDDGIAVYGLGTTGGAIGPDAHDLGQFHMVAQVTVRDGKPNVAVIPVGQVLPGDFLTDQMLEERQAITESLWISPRATPTGLEITLRQGNPTQQTLRAQMTCVGNDGVARCQPVEIAVAPGQTGQARLISHGGLGARIHCSYSFTSKSLKQDSMTFSQPLPHLVAVPQAKITADGDPSEWEDIAVVAQKARKDPADSSVAVRLAHDGRHLHLLVEVRDECIYTDDPSTVHNDSIELYWHVPKHEQTQPLNALASGRVDLAVPKEGQDVTFSWRIPHDLTPPALTAACRRTEDGYVYELSLPLAEIGARLSLSAGQEMCWRIAVNDRDVVDGQPVPRERLRIGGGSPSRYMRALFE